MNNKNLMGVVKNNAPKLMPKMKKKLMHFRRQLTEEEIRKMDEEKRRMQWEKTNNTIEGIVISGIRNCVYDHLKENTKKIVIKGMLGWGKGSKPVYSLHARIKDTLVCVLFGTHEAFALHNRHKVWDYCDPNFEEKVVSYVEQQIG